MLVVQKLGENSELATQELVRKVDRGVGDPRTVSPDGIGHVANVDGVQVFVIAAVFDENLIVQVVHVLGYKDVDISHDFENVQPL